MQTATSFPTASAAMPETPRTGWWRSAIHRVHDYQIRWDDGHGLTRSATAGGSWPAAAEWRVETRPTRGAAGRGGYGTSRILPMWPRF